jgi:16S rRNA processing protein RimM
VASNKPSPKLPSKPGLDAAGTQVPADLVIMGRVIGPRGIKGWIKIKTFTEFPDSLADFESWWLNQGGSWRLHAVEESELVHLGFSAKLQGCEDRNAAELLRGMEIALPRSALPMDADSIYWVDLIGLSVANEAGESLGTVDSLMETGANDVLVVKQDGKEQLIPYTERTVVSVDLAAKRIVVDWQKDW